ncbi:MAG: serpin family protein [Oscillospiraceae bacterium]|nr:serpin family protein [Oscillospiraceae bacterium]
MRKFTAILLILSSLLCGCHASPENAVDPAPIYAEDITASLLTDDDYEVSVLTELGIIEEDIDLSGELTRAEAVDLIDRLIPHDVYLVDFDESPYDDILGHWAEGLIKHYYNSGALAEIAEGSFEPDKAMTACEFISVLLRAMGYEYTRLETAYEEGVETGLLIGEYTKSIVNNDLSLTRSDACRLAYAAFTALTAEWTPLYRLLIEQGYYGEELADMITGRTEVNGGNSFADRLNGALPKDKNYMISPLSIKTALAMAANGAEGETRRQILDLIGVNNLEAYNLYVRDTIESYKDSAATLNIANSIWLNEDNTVDKFSDPFRTVIEKNYFGEVRTVNNRNAVSEINAWSAEKTNGKIPTIINEPYFAAALINAVYFNGLWQHDFDEADTEKAGFTQADGSLKETDFMRQTGYFSYWDTDKSRIVELPYKDTAVKLNEEGEYTGSQRYRYLDLGMYILLPKTESLDVSAELNKATENYESAYLDLSVPKFKFESEFALKDILKNLGMEKAYTDGAEFGPMFAGGEGSPGLDILHKTYIDVNEKGTEAAAVTSLFVTGSAPPPEPIEFKADRPFSFAVRDNTTGEILFMGEYMYAE